MIFDSNARIEHLNGVRFYEQDILKMNYKFSNDIIAQLDIDYMSAGFGIVLTKINNRSNIQGDDSYLIKLGHDEFDIYRSQYKTLERLYRASNFFKPPLKNKRVTFSKFGRRIVVQDEERELGEYILPSEIDEYYLSIYSSGGNTVNHVSLASNVPSNWAVNMKNTDGGRIKFFLDGFQLEKCKNDAEIEQHEIPLRKGVYYFDYEAAEIDGKNDIKSYVFHSDDKSFDDEKKHIVGPNGRFEMEKDGKVNVKFKGSGGIIKNICIKEDPLEKYVSSGKQAIETDGSAMEILLDDVLKVTWKGKITSIPSESIDSIQEYAVFSTSLKNYLMSDLNLRLDKEYDFVFELEGMRLTISDERGGVSRTSIVADANEQSAKVFMNISGTIRDVIVTKLDGEEINILVQKTAKVFVPGSIKGPIIVTDENYKPLELSSSYRVIKDEMDNDTYLFTNWEREIFYFGEEFKLENVPDEVAGSIRIYGVKEDAVYDLNGIFRTERNLDNIDHFTNRYEILSEEDFAFDYETGAISVKDEVLRLYSLFVVDYLKEDSYCINYVKELNAYEVDISTNIENVYVMYDYLSEDSGLASVSEYTITSIEPSTKNKYVVLRKE